MPIFMTPEQAQALAEYIKKARNLIQSQREGGETYYWRSFAADLGMPEGTLKKIRDADGGINTDTLAILVRAFGDVIYDLLELPRGGEPQLKVKGLNE